VTVTKIERYMFLDEKKKVKIYIEIEGIGALEDQISCDFGSESFKLTIQDQDDSIRVLNVEDLSRPIDAAKSKLTLKPNKIVISLHKDTQTTWYSLKKSS